MIPHARSIRPAAVVVCFLLLGFTQLAHASSLTFGGLAQVVNTGSSITLSSPGGVVVDPAGDLFIADTNNNRIIEVSASGTASVVSISGLTSPSSLSSPAALAIDAAGNLYVADTGNSRVVKVSPSGAGTVVSIAGVSPALSFPQGVAVDSSGDVFIADTGNSRIVKVTSGGTASALAINVSPGLSSPKGLAVNPTGTLYIADSNNNRIVRVASGSTTGVVVSFGTLTALSAPSAVAVDRIGNIYVADTGNQRIAEVDTAGTGADFLSSTTYLQGTTLSSPLGVAVDVFGTVYIADTAGSPNRVLAVNPSLDADPTTGAYFSSLDKSVVEFGHITLGAVTPTSRVLQFTIGGPLSVLGGVSAFTSGTANLDFQIVAGSNTTCTSSTTAGTSCTVEVAFLPTAPGVRSGALVLYDSSSNPVLSLPLVGFGDAPVAALNPNTGTVISTGSVALANPYEVTFDGAGDLYVGVYSSKSVVKIPTGGGAAAALSLGTPGTPPTAVQNITGVAVDGSGNLFIADHQNSRILVMTPAGVVSVLNITGISPALGFPTTLQFDPAGNLYIADFTNGRIVEVSSLKVTGSTSTGRGTVIQTGAYSFGGATLTGLAVDWMGNIYAAARTQNNSSIVKVTAAGTASLLAIPSNITPAISNPQGVAVDSMGNVYIVDTNNDRIVQLTTSGVATALGVSGLPSPATTLGPTLFGVSIDPAGNLYISDWTNNRIVYVNVSAATLKFPTATKQGTTDTTDGAKTATVTNIGNQPLSFSADPGYTADFVEYSSDANPCTASTSLSSGAQCDVSMQFVPQSVGSISSTISVADNSLNLPGTPQVVTASGTGTNPGDTTATVVTISPTSLVSGQPATVAATVTDTTTGNTSVVPTGSVTFTDTVGSTTTTLNNGSPVTLSAGTATLSGVVLSGIGSHSIRANYAGVSGTYLASSSATAATASLSKASVTVTGPTSQPLTVTVGQTSSAAVTVTPPYTTVAVPSGTISYSILDGSNSSVASGSPALTAGSASSTATVPIPSTLIPGTYTISVTYGGDGNYLASSTATTIQLQVSQLTPTITWTPALSSITYSATLSGILNASAQYGSTSVPGTFAYTATRAGGSASSITSASVLSAGSYTLTATFTPTDSTTYKSVSATASLTVNQATPSITWATPAAITYGTALGATQLNAISTVAGTFTYTPAAGAVVAAGSQTLAVTFTPTDTTDYNTATAQVMLTVNKATPSITWTPPAAVTYGTALGATQLNATSTVAGTFTYTPAAGAVVAAGSQTLAVTFTPTDTADYNTATAQVMLTVNKATPSITWATPAAITYGTALGATQLNATSTVPGNFTYTPAAGAVETVGQHTVVATFTPTDTTDYNTATAQVMLTVNKATPSITWTPPAAITYGTALGATQLNATSTVAGTFTYTPAAGAVVAAGSQTLAVTFTPTDATDYSTATAQVMLTVNKAAPSITWATPAAITYGTALGATQLNATSTVAGTFTYTPMAGTVETVGRHTLMAVFTPTDTTDYSTATAQVTLTVNKAAPSIALVSSMNPALVTSAVTFTATLSSSAGTPTGAVGLYDGTTLLASVTLSNGVAALTTSSLAVGTHSMSVVYSGDTNFGSATSSAVSELIQDFTIGSGSGGSGQNPTQTVVPGGTATYNLSLVPSGTSTTFPVPITMSVTGLPPGATATVSPQTIPANTAIPHITLSVQLPQTTASLNPNTERGSQMPLLLWSVLLLPFAGKLRRAGKRLGKLACLLLLIGTGIIATIGLSGCGAKSGYFAQQQKTYTVTVTATAGAVSRSTNVTLIVE